MVSLDGKGWDLLPAATQTGSRLPWVLLLRQSLKWFCAQKRESCFFYPLQGTRQIQLRQEGPTGGERADGGRVERENWANKVNSLNKSHSSAARKGLCAETPPTKVHHGKLRGEEKYSFLNKKYQKRRRVSQAVWIMASSRSSLIFVPNGLAVGRGRCPSYLALPMTTAQLYKTLYLEKHAYFPSRLMRQACPSH